jgi:small subunit ribosomal protein S1
MAALGVTSGHQVGNGTRENTAATADRPTARLRYATRLMAESATLAPPPEAKVVEGSGGLLLEIDGRIVPNYDATITPFEEGDVVTGKVVRIDNDEVLVDIGYKSEGVIPSNELSIRKSVDPAEEVEMGEEVDALVLTKEDQDGRLVLSKKRARFEKAWRRIEAAAESGEPVTGQVIEVVKGGLIIDLGVRGFLPASLVDIRRVPHLDEYLGQSIECRVIELNRSRNNVVLSRRAVLEEERKEVRQQILERLQPGMVVEGNISNIVDFGAFVDLDGIDGLIHISELSWSHVNHPSEILSIGDTVQVKVLDIDRDRQRISLGLKQTQEDPWQRVVDTYNVGDELEGKVTKVVTFGAFVEILDGVEGLVHISELAGHHVENPREVIEPGQTVRVKVLEIDSERRRLSLSIKRVEGQVLPRRELTGEEAAAGNLDDVPELGLSEDVFAADDVPAPEPAAPPEPPKPREPRERERSVGPEVMFDDAAAAHAAIAASDAPVAEEPVAEVAVEEAPVAEEPVAEAPAPEEAPVEEAPVDEAPAEEAPADETPVDAGDATPVDEPAA